MKKLLLTIAVLLGLTSFMWGQNDLKYAPIYYHMVSLFDKLPIHKSDIIFLGNSITHFCEWSELLGNNPHIKNRGISGDIAEGVYDRLDQITKGQPKKIFLLIGINNLSKNYTVDSILTVIGKIADKISKDTPHTKLYIQSVFPVNSDFKAFPKHSSKGKEVTELNKGLLKMCEQKGFTYIDIYTSLKCKDSEKLDPAYTCDGLHINGDGYMVWKKIVEKYL